jgi:hypothetical protein
MPDTLDPDPDRIRATILALLERRGARGPIRLRLRHG